MRFFQYIYYFFRSLYLRGFLNTFKLLTYEAKYEKQLGVNTHKIVNLNELTLDGDESDENHHYQGASYYVLFLVLNNLPNTVKQKPFVDFGCGKGRALFVAEQCGFTNTIGVDIAMELINDANKNLLNYNKKNSESILTFLFCDATKYTIASNATVFYFFNPFGKSVMQQVLQNIKHSVEQNPREIYCVYLNPKYKEVFIELNFIIEQTVKNKRYTEAIIFKL